MRSAALSRHPCDINPTRSGDSVRTLFADMFISLDGSAFGRRSPGYFGYFGPDLQDWIDSQMSQSRMHLMGRKTYELLAGLPEEHRDGGWERTATTPTMVYSRTLAGLTWSAAELRADDAVNHVCELKKSSGPDLRTIGSLSLVQQLLRAGLVDHLRLMVFPVILAETGEQPMFAAVGDHALRLDSQGVLDGRVLLLDYVPEGLPPYNG
jgi:dihydrofolate reductase